MEAVVATFNQEKALVGAFSVITNLRMELFEALLVTVHLQPGVPPVRHHDVVEVVHGEARGSVELAVTLAAGAE